ncbi:MAG: cmk [candidate division NC10 bacterium]|nr:cmk [candidate division NC10 bacterium]
MKREGKQGRLVIAVDGPVGAGKSTAARLLAERLGCRYIDSGAMYRALAWKALQMDLDLEDERRLMRLLGDTSIALEGSGDGLIVLVDGQEVSREIRTPEVEQASSKISTLAGIRRVMVARQREMASQGGVVMDGRDIGTVVFPDADVKFYLEARLEERAKRRYLEARSAGVAGDLEKFTEEVKVRDARDMGRSASPLRKAEDAVTIDTTGLNAFQVVAAMENETNRRVGPVEGSA